MPRTNGKAWREPIKKRKQKTTHVVTLEFHVSMKSESISLDQYNNNLNNKQKREVHSSGRHLDKWTCVAEMKAAPKILTLCFFFNSNHNVKIFVAALSPLEFLANVDS